VNIKPGGNTQLQTTLDGSPVVIEFVTHAIPMPPMTKDFPFDYASNCTASRNPCVLLNNLRIKVSGKEIRVPRSAYFDCSDLLRASLTKKGQIYSLLLRGGDAAEAYKTTIRFTHTRVIERSVVAAENPGFVCERTKYFVTPPLD
jgi:hypothetical protein